MCSNHIGPTSLFLACHVLNYPGGQTLSHMERNHKILLAVALVISLILLIVDIYLGGIAFIIFIVLLMSVFIMEDAKMLPNVTASLNNEATAVVFKNGGNATAFTIHAV
ncbi:MAG TPA: hypothetical protein PKH71_08155, partial [Methanoregulaceae archaeon]|nr:hypothetical protein [Methanoregulaceae archaeon]